MTQAELRAERNARLAETDYYFLSDVYSGLEENQRVVYSMYRQALRDLPAAYEGQDDITDVEWPELPLA